MQFAMVEPAERDGVFVADLAAKSPRLRKAKMVGFRWSSATDDAWLRGDEFTMILVVKPDGLRSDSAAGDVRGRNNHRLRRVKGFTSTRWRLVSSIGS
jgi:hypothetical protein